MKTEDAAVDLVVELSAAEAEYISWVLEAEMCRVESGRPTADDETPRPVAAEALNKILKIVGYQF